MFLPMLEDDKESVKFVSRTIARMLYSQGQESHAFFSNFLKVKSFNMSRSMVGGIDDDFEGYSYFDQIVIDSSDVVKDLENRIFRRVIDLKGEFQQEQMEIINMVKDMVSCTLDEFIERYPYCYRDPKTKKIIHVPRYDHKFMKESLIDRGLYAKFLRLSNFVQNARHKNCNREVQRVVSDFFADNFLEKGYKSGFIKQHWEYFLLFHDMVTCDEEEFQTYKEKYGCRRERGMVVHSTRKKCRNKSFGAFMEYPQRNIRVKNHIVACGWVPTGFFDAGYVSLDNAQHRVLRLFRYLKTHTDEQLQEEYRELTSSKYTNGRGSFKKLTGKHKFKRDSQNRVIAFPPRTFEVKFQGVVCDVGYRIHSIRENRGETTGGFLLRDTLLKEDLIGKLLITKRWKDVYDKC